MIKYKKMDAAPCPRQMLSSLPPRLLSVLPSSERNIFKQQQLQFSQKNFQKNELIGCRNYNFFMFRTHLVVPDKIRHGMILIESMKKKMQGSSCVLCTFSIESNLRIFKRLHDYDHYHIYLFWTNEENTLMCTRCHYSLFRNKYSTRKLSSISHLSFPACSHNAKENNSL